jgi:hypothetical protein
MRDFFGASQVSGTVANQLQFHVSSDQYPSSAAARSGAERGLVPSRDSGQASGLA